MNNIINTAQKWILVKDMTGLIDFDSLNNEFDKLEWKGNVSNKISKEMHLLDNDILVPSKNVIVNECMDYLNHSLALKPFYNKLKMTYSWGNITDPGEAHHEHMHPFSIVSGVVYLDNNPSNLNLYIEGFMPEVPYFLTMNKTFVSLKSLLSDINVDPAANNNLKNHMVLFLSNCAHFVEKTDISSTPRKSISFNTFWDGLTGVKEESLGSLIF